MVSGALGTPTQTLTVKNVTARIAKKTAEAESAVYEQGGKQKTWTLQPRCCRSEANLVGPCGRRAGQTKTAARASVYPVNQPLFVAVIHRQQAVGLHASPALPAAFLFTRNQT